MGCNGGCGGNASASVGSTLNSAIIIGDPTNDVRRVKVAGQIAGLNQGAVKYVRGSAVEGLIEDGTLLPMAGGVRHLPAARPGTSLYYVGGIGYADMGSARVRSGQTGEDIVVRTLGG